MDKEHINEGSTLYRMITDSVLSDIDRFKSAQTGGEDLNEKIFLNIFCMIRLFEEEKEKEEKEKELNCFIPMSQYSNENTQGNAVDANDNFIGNANKANDNEKEKEKEKKGDNSWAEVESFSIRDTHNMLLNNENDSKMVNNLEFTMTNQSIFFQDAFKGVSNDIFNSNSDSNANANGGDFDEDDDFLVFKKEDLIISVPTQSMKKQHSEGSNEALIKLPEVHTSSLADNNDKSPTQSNNSNSNTNSNNKSISNTNVKPKSPIQSQGEISLDTISETKAKRILKSPDISKLLYLDDLLSKPPPSSYNLSKRLMQFYLTNMNDSYLYLMNSLYTDMKIKSKRKISLSTDINQLLFINLFKEFILSIGITEKNFYEDCVRNLVYQKEKFTFEHFLDCFQPILEYNQKESPVKFKFLLHLVKPKDEEYSLADIADFFRLGKCKLVYESVVDIIENGLMEKYYGIYKGQHRSFNVKRLSLILETFF